MTKIAFEGGTPVRNKLLPFGSPVIGKAEINEVVRTLRSGWIGTGPRTLRFEEEFRRYCGARYALAVNSCTAGMHLSLLASGIGQGDDVITTPMTFAATANVIVHTGAVPVFADIEDHTFNLNPDCIEKKITARTKAILPVHFAGLPCKMKQINELAKQYNLKVIEDAAHAVGGVYNGRKIGNSSNPTCFSFYANKNITTGEGGMITLQNKSFVKKIDILRLHGLSRNAWKRFHSKKLLHTKVIAPGYKYNMTDIQASLGIHQLRRLNLFLKKRERIASIYDKVFQDRSDLELQVRPNDISQNRHALHLYLLILNMECFRVSRAHIVSAIRAENIGVGIHYVALYREPYYKNNFPASPSEFPITEKVSAGVLSLPLTPQMSKRDINDVIEGVTRVLDYYRR